MCFTKIKPVGEFIFQGIQALAAFIVIVVGITSGFITAFPEKLAAKYNTEISELNDRLHGIQIEMVILTSQLGDAEEETRIAKEETRIAKEKLKLTDQELEEILEDLEGGQKVQNVIENTFNALDFQNFNPDLLSQNLQIFVDENPRYNDFMRGLTIGKGLNIPFENLLLPLDQN